MVGGIYGVKSMDNYLHGIDDRIFHYVFTFPMDEFTWTPRILDHRGSVAYEVQKCCKYTKYYTQLHQFYSSCSILYVNRPCSVTTTNCKPNIICHSLHYRFTMLQTPSLTK